MQNIEHVSLDIYTLFGEEELDTIPFSLSPGDRIFFSGDLGAGKSTFIRSILRRYFSDPTLVVRSPTYTYYQRYGTVLYHFDLYRLEAIENFSLIGGDDILSERDSICLIEWPEILGSSLLPTQSVQITLEEDGSRRIEIRTHRGGATG